MESDDLEKFILKKPKESIIVLQTNDFYDLDSHINCYPNLEEFKKFVLPLLSKKWIISESSLNLDGFTRFMIIGQ